MCSTLSAWGCVLSREDTSSDDHPTRLLLIANSIASILLIQLLSNFQMALPFLDRIGTEEYVVVGKGPAGIFSTGGESSCRRLVNTDDPEHAKDWGRSGEVPNGDEGYEGSL